MAFDRNEYNKKYQTEKYYRFSVTLPITRKDQIEQAAKAQNKSVNKFITDCVLSAIGQDQQTDSLPWEQEQPQKPNLKHMTTNEWFDWQRQHSRSLEEDEDEPLPF